MIEKICNICKISKDKNEFFKCKNAKDGIDYKCKKCANKLRKKHRDSYKYDKEIHDMHHKQWTDEDLSYLCAFWEKEDDKVRLALSMGRTYIATQQKIYKLKSQNKFDYYKKIGEDEFSGCN